MTPWDALLEAQTEALEASRTDDTERQRAALAALQQAQEHMGALGGLLIVLALDHAGYAVQRKLATVFGQLGLGAWDRATAAQARASWAIEEIDVLRERVRELEKRLAELTPAEVRRGRQVG